MKVISHKLIPARGVEEVVVEDSHGRTLHIHAPIFSEVDPEQYIQARIAEFEEQEKAIRLHIAARQFHPETLERKC